MKEDQSLTIFCKNIRILRIKNGLSQKEMAKILRIGVGSLRTIEAGHIPPRLAVMRSIMRQSTSACGSVPSLHHFSE